MLQGILINKVISMIAKQFKLDKVLSYVENDNELDYKVSSIEKRLDLIEKMAHPPREFVSCKTCEQKIQSIGDEVI
tara:strand:- start:1014 stop:1241 length:228 start_codon:yes stop_codon:yes gene_type:complete